MTHRIDEGRSPARLVFGSVLVFIGGALVSVAGWWVLAAAGAVFIATTIPLFGLRRRQTLGVSTGLLLVMAGATSFVPGENSTASIVVRVAGLVLLLLVGAASRSGSELHRHRSIGLPRRSIWLVSTGLLIYLLTATLVHGQYFEFVTYTGALVFAVAAFASCKGIDPGALLGGVRLALTIVLFGSLALAVTVPSVAFEGGRLRGLTENANGLGFYAFLLGALTLLTWNRGRAVPGIIGIASVTAVLFLSASRASALALVIVVAAKVLGSRFGAKVAVAGVVVLGAAYIAYFVPELGDVVLFRTTNTRAGSVAEGLAVLRESPVIGFGMDSERGIVASSLFRAAVHAGMLGIAGVSLMWLAIARTGRTVSTLGFALAAVVNSVAEGWLLSPIGPEFVTFLFAWHCVLLGQGPTEAAVRRLTRNVALGVPR